MARFIVAAIDLPTGYKQGDLVSAVQDNHVWTINEGLPLFWQVDVPQVAWTIARDLTLPLYEPAMPGDLELASADPVDRRIRRGRSDARMFFNLLPRNKQNELNRGGHTELNLGQATAAFRRVFFHRPSGEIRDTGVGAFG